MSNVFERLTGEAAIGEDVRESTGLPHAPFAEDAGARRGYHLNEYLTNRPFGGPEEGGWWYDTGTFVACHGVYPTCEEARAALDAMQTRLAERRRGLHAPALGALLRLARRPGRAAPRRGLPQDPAALRVRRRASRARGPLRAPRPSHRRPS